jgi:2-polyprenyl-3-methyl-5-hydroxy-6-metoxy-1,4-benzoquinol methylase
VSPFPKDPAEYFDWIYSKWELEWERFGEHPDFHGKSVLDFGCGLGAFSVQAAKEGAVVTGLDTDTEEIRFAKDHNSEHFPQLNIAFTDRSIDDLSETFDFIITHEVFEHVLDLDTCLTSLFNHLKPGGRMYASWGPLWASPLGGHQLSLHVGGLTVPYSHLIKPFAFHRLRARTGGSEKSLADIHLNGLGPAAYKQAFARTQFEIVRWTVNAGNHPMYKVFRSAARLVPRLATANIYAIFQRE